MQLRTASLLTALLVPLVAVPTLALGAPINPAPGTCTTDNSDPNYTCKTCTSSGGGVVTITCTPKPKVKKPVAVWW
jgi:hypothetical protein